MNPHFALSLCRHGLGEREQLFGEYSLPSYAHHLRPQPDLLDQSLQLLIRQPPPLPCVRRQRGLQQVRAKRAALVARGGGNHRLHAALKPVGSEM